MEQWLTVLPTGTTPVRPVVGNVAFVPSVLLSSYNTMTYKLGFMAHSGIRIRAHIQMQGPSAKHRITIASDMWPRELNPFT